MADWSLRGGGRLTSGGALVASSAKTTVTSGNSNVKGSWTQLIASTSDAAALLVIWATVGTSGRRYLLDIGVGGAGSETVLISNVQIVNSAALSIPIMVPINIPPGSRIAARCQATSNASTMTVAVSVGGMSTQTPPPLSRWTEYGITTASSTGVSLNPGATPHTKGAYSQIVASTTNPIRLLFVSFGNATVTTMTLTDYLVDIAIGAGGSEQIIAPDMIARSSSAIVSPPVLGPIPVPPIPAGTRLAMRCSNTTASQLLECALYGLD
jgi:hypothetical protein